MRTFYSWLYSYGVRRDPMFAGLVWRVSAAQQRATMAEIRAQIIPERGVRITTDEIPGFPAVDIQCQLFDITAVDEVNEIYEDIRPALQALHARSASDKSPESAITQILRARQRIELLKCPAAIELAEDRLAQGFSVGLFVEFRATVIELARLLKCKFIDGTVTGPERDEIIRKFQANETRCIVLNSAAGGIAISLQDIHGDHPRFGIVLPGWSATVFRQLLGRFPRDGGRSKSHFRVMFAANTIETRMYAVLKLKLDNLDSLTDGDMCPDNLKMI